MIAQEILEVHLGVAFLVVLLAVVIGWVQLGRRVMVAILGLQVLIGAVVAAFIRPPVLVVWHILAALLAMGAYIAARRIGEKERGVPAAGAFSALGLLLIGATIWLGWKMVGRL
jgi:hypothetical protein